MSKMNFQVFSASAGVGGDKQLEFGFGVAQAFFHQELHPGSLSPPVVHPRRESNPLAQNLHGRPGGYFQ